MNALIHLPGEEESLYERKLTAHFENGETEISVTCENLSGLIAILFNTVAVLQLDSEAGLSVRLTYWHLTEDFDRVEVTASDCKYEDFNMPLLAEVRRLTANAKTNLLKNLARHRITLTGEKGEL